MTRLPYHIQRMSRAHLGTAIEWAEQEGWNPGRHDVDIFHTIDVRGHFMAWLGDDPVACISALRHGTTYGSVGLFLVQTDWRGQGLGSVLWKAALEHLKGCVVGLDCAPERQAWFRRSGFEAAWNIRRFQALGHPPSPRDPHIVKLNGLPLELLAGYDRAFHPEPRPVFLQAWIQQRHGMALGWLQDGRLRGYGVVRTCANGHKIGPLCADTLAIADALLDALLGCVVLREPVYLEMPEPNRDAIALAERHGMVAAGTTVRMVRGPMPRLAIARQYAITARELG